LPDDAPSPQTPVFSVLQIIWFQKPRFDPDSLFAGTSYKLCCEQVGALIYA
jgi:hypothetical protein